ncbi:MAG: 6,7-dimethyl-8-ribityllumazine synthase [Patescibacteria group bacterium]|nr:6,7-dimethyl-8-ribityllumazine synthase [Patescibacteria group bacterium]
MKTNKFEKLNGKNFKIAIVQARFNQEITDDLRKGAENALKEAGVKIKAEIFLVPGSVEIPLACQKIALNKKFDGIIALGNIIKGETAHFDYVAKAVTEGIMEVILKNNFPITFGVITVYNLEQAKARSQNDKNNKGYEAGMALIEVLNLKI